MTPSLTGTRNGTGITTEGDARDRAGSGTRARGGESRTEIPFSLIDRARSKDQAACRQIVEALERPVFATIHRFLGRRFSGQVEDIAQEVFVKVFRSLERFDPDRGFKFTTWVYALIRNHCFDVSKKKHCIPVSLTSRDDGEGQMDVPDRGRSPERGVLDAELGHQIELALDALDDAQRQAFILKEYQGLDCDEIGEVMGTATGTVKSRLFRARVILRSRLAPYLEGRDPKRVPPTGGTASSR